MSEFVHSKVNPNRLNTAAGSIDNSLSMLENAYKAIEEALCVTLQPTWTGPASTNFFKQYTVDAQTFASHVKALRSINDKLKEASGIFDRADNRARETVSSLSLGME